MVKKEQLALEVNHKFNISIKKGVRKIDTMCNLYETMTITQTVSLDRNTNKVAWIMEGMHKMGSTVTNMPGNKYSWITKETLKTVFTVSFMPSNMD